VGEQREAKDDEGAPLSDRRQGNRDAVCAYRVLRRTTGSHLISSAETTLIVPTTGEVINPDDPAGCLRVLTEIRELESKLKELKSALTEALGFEFSRLGTKTIELNGIKAELRGGSEIVWDVEILEELRGLGLPDERMVALVTTEISYKVNASVAKQLAAANEAYAEVIERAKSTIPKSSYVAIKKGGR